MATRIARAHTSGNRTASTSAWRTLLRSRCAPERLRKLRRERRSRASASPLVGEPGGSDIPHLDFPPPDARVPPDLRFLFPRVDELRFLTVPEIDDGSRLQFALDFVL